MKQSHCLSKMSAGLLILICMAGFAQNNSPEEYGYKKGLFLPSSGYLRVKVATGRVTVDYVRSALPENKRRGIRNGSIGYSYVLLPRLPRL
jgi:hypothetical protein